LLVMGGGAGFAGATFVVSSVHHLLLDPDRNLALVLVPVGLVSIVVGLALLVVTIAVYVLGRAARHA
jgi:protease PrsW